MFYSSYINPPFSSSPQPSSSLPLSSSLPPSSFLNPSSPLPPPPSSLLPPPSSFLPPFQTQIDPSNGIVYLQVTTESCPEELISDLPARAALNSPGLLSVHGFKRINSTLQLSFEHAIPLSSSFVSPSSSTFLLSLSLLLQASSFLREKGIKPNFSELFMVKDGSLRLADLSMVGVIGEEEWMSGGGEGEKGDVFKLGGKMMEWIGLIKASEIWNNDLMKWNNRLLRSVLDKISSEYGESFRDLISEMIEENQALRIDIQTTTKMIQTIEKLIPSSDLSRSSLLRSSLPLPSVLPPPPSNSPDENEIEAIMRKILTPPLPASSNLSPPSSNPPPTLFSLFPPSHPHHPPSLYSDTSPRSSRHSSFLPTPKENQKPSAIISSPSSFPQYSAPPPPSVLPPQSSPYPPSTFPPPSSSPIRTSSYIIPPPSSPSPPFSYPPLSSFPPPPSPSSEIPPPASSSFYSNPPSSYSPPSSYPPPPPSSYPPPSSSLPPLYHPVSSSPSSGIKRAVYQTPEKRDFLSKIHKATPGSLGKSSIKIVYTPSKSTAEKMKQLDQEFENNKEKIADERRSAERSFQVLKSTVEFLRNTPVSSKKRE